MKNKKSKILQFLFGCCLFLSVGISCIKPVATQLIKEAYIGSALSFRINDAISLACPDMELDKAIELQKLVEGHSQLDSVIHRYLRAYAAWLTGDHTSLDNLDNSKAFKKMNQNILKETKKRNPDAELAVSDKEFTAYLVQAESEVEEILRTQIPQNLQNFGRPADAAIKAYKLLTSFQIQAVLLLIMLLILLLPMFLPLSAAPSESALPPEASSIAACPAVRIKGFRHSLGTIFLLHGLFWAVIPFICIKAADRWLLAIVDRIIGRSMFLSASPFVLRGGILIAVGGVLWILGRFCQRCTPNNAV